MGGRVVFGRYHPNELEMSMLLLRSSVSDIMPPQRRLVNAYERRAGVSSWADRRRGSHRRDVCEGEDKWRVASPQRHPHSLKHVYAGDDMDKVAVGRNPDCQGNQPWERNADWKPTLVLAVGRRSVAG